MAADVRWYQVVGLVLLAGLAAVFGGRVILTSVSSDEVDQRVTDALVQNCLDDRGFRREYKQRAKAEQGLFRKEVAVNEALIEVVNEIARGGELSPALHRLGTVLDVANAKLNDLRALIDIRPLPDCDEAHDTEG